MTINAATNSASAAASAPPPLPRWDMTVVYPGMDAPAFQQDFERVVQQIADLRALCDQHHIGASTPPPSSDDAAAVFETVASRYNDLLDQARTLRAYISAFVSADSRDARAQAALSAWQKEAVTLGLLGTRLAVWVGTLDVDDLLARSPLAREHAFFLQKTKTRAAHLMPPGEEVLAAELSLGGSSAWAKLHGDVSSQLSVVLDDQTLPMSVVRTLASDPDRGVRERAYKAELAAWEQTALPLAAAMNSIKHEANTLAAHRGWESPLAAALFDNNIDRATLEAMLSAARASFPFFRRYLRAKARVVSGRDGLCWYDLFAPMGDSSQTWSWPDAENFVAEQFGTYSKEMSDFARRAFRERWIDAGPRPGKRDGAFCMALRGDESRILHNYKPAFGGVSTLAHELGHAYHNRCLAGRTALQRGTPMTLAETASIFCETIVRQTALQNADAHSQIAILEASLQGACQVVVDITSRFLFEQRVLERRRERELSASELCELMRQAQRETYSDGLDEATLHPYMWAVKGHYYGSSFYNFPYMFGLLFGLGLYACYQADPDAFRVGYDDLLSSTGLADAATLAARFGIDLREEAFWTSSLDLIDQDVSRFETLIGENA